MVLELRGDAEVVLNRLGHGMLGRAPATPPHHAHPERCIELVVQEQGVGNVCELHPRLRRAFEIESPTAVLTLDLSRLSALAPEVVRMQQIA